MEVLEYKGQDGQWHRLAFIAGSGGSGSGESCSCESIDIDELTGMLEKYNEDNNG